MNFTTRGPTGIFAKLTIRDIGKTVILTTFTILVQEVPSCRLVPINKLFPRLVSHRRDIPEMELCPDTCTRLMEPYPVLILPSEPTSPTRIAGWRAPDPEKPPQAPPYLQVFLLLE